MESISRISSLLETARDLTLEAAQSASAVRGLRPGGSTNRRLPIPQLKKLLDSRNERDVLDGLRRVISMMYRSEHCLPLFSSVIKNVASPSMEIKKLVYIYLVHYAESEPDLALLSINTIQKSLTDQNPQARAMALKAMSGIRVPVISQIVSLAIKKGSGDMSPIVRKAAALAIPKCYRLDPGTSPQLLEYLSTLLGDKQYFVAGAAVMAFLEVCPDRIDLIHKHYRGLVRKLVDMDEWGQLATLRLMTVYSRRCFPRRLRKSSTKPDFYDSDSNHQPSHSRDEVGNEIPILDPDLELLLNTCKPLLQSRNSAVIVSVARCFLYLGTPGHIDQVVGPLVSLLRSPLDIQQLALYNIVSVCLIRPQPFVRYTTRFLLRTTEPPPIWRLKLEVLTLVFPHCTAHLKGVILNELHHFSQSSSSNNKDLMKESIKTIGRCAQSADPTTSERCLRVLLRQVFSNPEGSLVAESLTVIRHLIQHSSKPEMHLNTVVHLAKNLDSVTDANGRATIIWLVGEFAGVQKGEEDVGRGKGNIAADVLRILVKNFAEESEMAKMQIVLLAAKVYVHHHRHRHPQDVVEDGQQGDHDHRTQDPEMNDEEDRKGTQINLLWTYILLLARYDTSYDLRDRARFLKALLGSDSAAPRGDNHHATMQLATLILLAPKPSPYAPSPSEMRRGYVLGSMGLILGGGGGEKDQFGRTQEGGFFELPDWVKDGEEPDPKLRDEQLVGVGGSLTPGSAAFGGKNKDGSMGNTRQISAAERLDGALRASKSSSNKGGFGVGGGEGYAGSGGSHTPHGGNNGGKKEKTLDDWLDEDDGPLPAQSKLVNVESERPRRKDADEEEEEEEESGSEEQESGSEEEEDDEEEEDEEDMYEGRGGEGQKLISG
ncbi:MAG: Type I transmembrane sorting receptor [Watsoniomyces obsoletus]|nr:MAG: Type I transmembrane sorting receptor [Watsoniomyces obsoletus]